MIKSSLQLDVALSDVQRQLVILEDRQLVELARRSDRVTEHGWRRRTWKRSKRKRGSDAGPLCESGS